jgi:S1-C subfamily serine protease
MIVSFGPSPAKVFAVLAALATAWACSGSAAAATDTKPAVPASRVKVSVNAQIAAAEKAERLRVELIARLTPSVISVFRVSNKGDEMAAGSGSGVIISPDGYALSNFHVTETFRELRVGLPGGKIYKARLCGLDRTGDIALIKIESKEPLPAAKLGSSAALTVGDPVITMGNPFMLATDFNPTVSLGIVSGLHRYLTGAGLMSKDLIYADAIQVDAALNPGNSGGPLFNMAGEVVGINGRIAPRHVQGMAIQKLNAGIGFAVPIDGIKAFLDELKAGHEVDRGYLGVSKAEPAEGGLKIQKIAEESPAELFGLKEGDVILRLDGTPIYGHGQLENMIQVHPAGTRVKFEVRRGSEVLQRTVQLAGIQTVALLKLAEMNIQLPQDNNGPPAPDGGRRTRTRRPARNVPGSKPEATSPKTQDQEKGAP